MARQANVETRKAILRARGVPERFVEALATRRGPGGFIATAMIYLIGAVVIMLGIMATLVLYDDDLQRLARPYFYPGQEASLLFYPAKAPFLLLDLSVLPVALTIICVVMILISRRPPAAWPAYDGYAEMMRTLRPSESPATITPDARFAGLADLADDAAFLAAARPARATWGRAARALGSVFLVMGFAIALNLWNGFDDQTVTPDGVTLHAPWRTTHYRFADATHADALCSTARRGGGPHYLVAFADRTIDLWEWRDTLHDLGPAQVLERVGQIDRRLSELGVPISRMPATKMRGCVASAAKAMRLQDPRALEQLMYGE